MAIERMKTVWLFDPHARERELMDRLATMGITHITQPGLPEPQEREALGVRQVYPELSDLERRVQLLRDTLEVLSRYAKTSRDFLSNFIATPVEVKSGDVRAAVAGIDEGRIHHEAREMDRRQAALSASLEKALERRKNLQPMVGLEFTVPGEKCGSWVCGWAGRITVQALERLRASGRLPEACAISETARTGRTLVVQAACLVEDRETALAVLRENGFAMIEPEAESLPFSQYLAKRDEEATRIRAELAETEKALRAFAEGNRSRIEMALGYWEERLNIANTAGMLARSSRLTVLRGYVRERELDTFQARVARELPDVAMIVRDPAPEEAVPVSLHNPRFFAPASFLVSMFGLPKYTTFDPTPVIFFSFLIFFGFCFGDVLYGVLLIALGAMLARKYRDYPGLRNFFLLLTYCGAPTIVVGALTGSWGADLHTYLPEGNSIRNMAQSLTVIDPVNQALAVLVLVLMMGMLNQLLALIMLMVRNFRAGDIRAAIFDSAFWLLLLPGFTILVSGMFAPVPPVLTRVAWGLCLLGACGLILTQGRAEKSFVGKAVIGVVSLYGIVGSYGITSYIGDTLSYSRLLALGLTTSIVGLSFNMIAGMTRGIPWAGPVIFLAILLGGHLLNFTLSVLGGFVHSARLTFVEFFGRFYDGGATPFTPLGTWRGRIRVTDRPTVWTD